MPARSQAQARYFGAAYSRGEIDRKTLDEFVKGVKVSRLPERVTPKKTRGSSRRGSRR